MSDQTETYVELRHINKSFENFKAADDVCFSVKKGKLIGLLGPSGSGKTTILRILAGLETADSGEIYIAGREVSQIPASRRSIGFVFQNYALFRHKNVYENIAFGLKVQHWKKQDIQRRVEELLELIGLTGLKNRYPKQLSGGQKQRVAFARALAVQPQLLLLDEPFAAIDAKVRKELREWLRELISRVGITSIFVTHDQDEAIEVADEIILTNHGRIEQIGSPVEVYNRPATPFVLQFLGSPIAIDHTRFKGFRDTAADAAALVRPEYITVRKMTEPCPYPSTTEEGIVERVAFRGTVMELAVRVCGERLTAYRPLNQEPVCEGERVHVFLQRVFLLEENGSRVTTAVDASLRR